MSMVAQIGLSIAMLGLGAGVGMALVRAAQGPTPFDRLLAVNTVGTLAVLAIAVFGFLTGRPEFLDIALLYALINFIGTIAVLKFFRAGTLGDHPTQQSDEPDVAGGA